jgi:hypothetical protein
MARVLERQLNQTGDSYCMVRNKSAFGFKILREGGHVFVFANETFCSDTPSLPVELKDGKLDTRCLLRSRIDNFHGMTASFVTLRNIWKFSSSIFNFCATPSGLLFELKKCMYIIKTRLCNRGSSH